eukprot:14457622-Alexandrium_andersonii.AAC.1
MAPARLKQLVGQAAQRAEWERAAKQRGGDAEGTQAGVDLTIHKRMLKELPPRRQGVLKSIAQGALWTEERRRKRGLQAEGNCKRCGAATEDLEHRFW